MKRLLKCVFWFSYVCLFLAAVCNVIVAYGLPGDTSETPYGERQLKELGQSEGFVINVWTNKNPPISFTNVSTVRTDAFKVYDGARLLVEVSTNGHIFVYDDPTNVTILGKKQ